MEDTSIDLGQPAPVGDDWLTQYIETGTLAQRSVDLYAKPDLKAKSEALIRRYEEIVASEVEESLGDSEKAELEEQMEAVHKEWEESRSTWYVRALEGEEDKRIRAQLEEDGLPQPKEPTPPASPVEPKGRVSDKQISDYKASVKRHEKALAAHEKTLEEFQEAQAVWAGHYNLAVISAALVKIEDHDGNVRATTITVEALQAMRKHFGEFQIARLVNAVFLAGNSDAKVAAPFSRKNSESTLT